MGLDTISMVLHDVKNSTIIFSQLKVRWVMRKDTGMKYCTMSILNIYVKNFHSTALIWRLEIWVARGKIRPFSRLEKNAKALARVLKRSIWTTDFLTCNQFGLAQQDTISKLQNLSPYLKTFRSHFKHENGSTFNPFLNLPDVEPSWQEFPLTVHVISMCKI